MEDKPQTESKPPAEAYLRFMLSQGGAFPELVAGQIARHKLPYRVEAMHDDTFELRDIFSRGETYLNKFITVNPSMLLMKEKAMKMSHSEHPVLITGETGTGKELIAKSMIGKREGLIQALNCAGLPSELIESELFGHVKGAFTNAVRDKPGLMVSAKGGICFLDEIGEMSMSAQSKLLRALQEKVVRPVGSNDSIEINCKIVCATNRDIKKMTEGNEPTFRLDLYARISTLELDITPLRNRMEDCESIVKSMVGGESFWLKHGKEVMESQYDLRLNVRGLEQYVIRHNVLGE